MDDHNHDHSAMMMNMNEPVHLQVMPSITLCSGWNLEGYKKTFYVGSYEAHDYHSAYDLAPAASISVTNGVSVRLFTDDDDIGLVIEGPATLNFV